MRSSGMAFSFSPRRALSDERCFDRKDGARPREMAPPAAAADAAVGLMTVFGSKPLRASGCFEIIGESVVVLVGETVADDEDDAVGVGVDAADDADIAAVPGAPIAASAGGSSGDRGFSSSNESAESSVDTDVRADRDAELPTLIVLALDSRRKGVKSWGLGHPPWP